MQGCARPGLSRRSGSVYRCLRKNPRRLAVEAGEGGLSSISRKSRSDEALLPTRRRESIRTISCSRGPDESGVDYVLCKGGRGKGTSFKSSRIVHRSNTRRGKWRRRAFYLELRKIADAGVVPDAANQLCSRGFRMRIEDSALSITTLTPQMAWSSCRHTRATVADIPGLIEGAHAMPGWGTGLRHIVRCKLLVS